MEIKKRVFIIGAGFSSDLYNLPTLRGFFGNRKPEEFEERYYSDLTEAIEIYFGSKEGATWDSINLEELDSFIEWKREIFNNEKFEKAKRALNNYVIRNLAILNISEETRRKQERFKSLFERSEGIITINYDRGIEAILDNGYIKYQHPFLRNLKNLVEKNKFCEREILLKLHGSIDWWGCFECGRIKVNISIQEQRISATEKERCERCGKELEQVRLPITPFRRFERFNETFKLMWKSAYSLLKEAEEIVIIGCAFNESDIYLRNLLRSAVRKSKNIKKIIVVDINSCVCNRIRELTGIFPFYAGNIDKYLDFWNNR